MGCMDPCAACSCCSLTRPNKDLHCQTRQCQWQCLPRTDGEGCRRARRQCRGRAAATQCGGLCAVCTSLLPCCTSSACSRSGSLNTWNYETCNALMSCSVSMAWTPCDGCFAFQVQHATAKLVEVCSSLSFTCDSVVRLVRHSSYSSSSTIPASVWCPLCHLHTRAASSRLHQQVKVRSVSVQPSTRVAGADWLAWHAP